MIFDFLYITFYRFRKHRQVTEDGRYEIHKSNGHGIIRLVVKNAKSEDTGNYVCRFTLEGPNGVFRKHTTVAVLVENRVKVGENVTMECQSNYEVLGGSMILPSGDKYV